MAVFVWGAICLNFITHFCRLVFLHTDTPIHMHTHTTLPSSSADVDMCYHVFCCSYFWGLYFPWLGFSEYKGAFRFKFMLFLSKCRFFSVRVVIPELYSSSNSSLVLCMPERVAHDWNFTDTCHHNTTECYVRSSLFKAYKLSNVLVYFTRYQ